MPAIKRLGIKSEMNKTLVFISKESDKNLLIID